MTSEPGCLHRTSTHNNTPMLYQSFYRSADASKAMSGAVRGCTACRCTLCYPLWMLLELYLRLRRAIDKKLRKRSKLPSVKKLWTVEEKLGGWGKAQSKFFSANVSPDPDLLCFSGMRLPDEAFLLLHAPHLLLFSHSPFTSSVVLLHGLFVKPI